MAASRFHFSIDDVQSLPQTNDAFHTTKPYLQIIEALIEKYKIKIDLYFFVDNIKNLQPVQLEASQKLLRFGPHAPNHSTPPHILPPAECAKFLQEGFELVDQIFGSDHRSTWLRLHYFSEPVEQHELLRKNGITHLLLTDKPALTYRMQDDAYQDLSNFGKYHTDGLVYLSSHIRFENLIAVFHSKNAIRHYLDRLIDTRETLVLFTHEINLLEKETLSIIEFCIDYLQSRGLEAI
ncbi:MAG: hypothetical protein KDI30_02630 [Pseudomonadales bacterium]|nr:hypothetical protein [Pseudomonadales bacterium]